MLSNSLYNPAILQQQNYLFQRNIPYSSANHHQQATMPSAHVQIQNYTKLPVSVQQQANTSIVPPASSQPQGGSNNIKSKIKDYGGGYKSNVITDTFIKPITNYIIPTIYNSRLDQLKPDAKQQAPGKQLNKKGLSVQNQPTKSTDTSTSQKSNESKLQQVVAKPKTQDTANSIKLILNSKKLDTPSINNTPTISPAPPQVQTSQKSPQQQQQNDAKSNATGSTKSLNSNGNLTDNGNTFRIQQVDSLESHVASRNSSITNGNSNNNNKSIYQTNGNSNMATTAKSTHDSGDTGNYKFILHEKIEKIELRNRSTDRISSAHDKMFTSINELEATLTKQARESTQMARSQYQQDQTATTTVTATRKTRFKTIHIEPSMVREAVERNRLLANEEQPRVSSRQQQQQVNSSKYNYQIGVLNNKDASKLNDYVNDYLAVEKEINSFYENFHRKPSKAAVTATTVTANTETTKPNNIELTTHNKPSNESIKSSLNSLLSVSSQTTPPLEQQQQSSSNQTSSNANSNQTTQLQTSGYSSFNSQQSNNKAKLTDTNSDKSSHIIIQTTYSPTKMSNNDDSSISSNSQATATVTSQNDTKTPAHPMSIAIHDEARKYFNNDKVTLIPVVEDLIRNFGAALGVKEDQHVSRAAKLKPEENSLSIPASSVAQNYKSPVRMIKIHNQIAKPDRKSKSQEPNIDGGALKLTSVPISVPKPTTIKLNETTRKQSVNSDTNETSVEIKQTVIDSPVKVFKEKDVTKIPVSIDSANRRVSRATEAEAKRDYLIEKDTPQQKPNRIPTKIKTSAKAEKSIKVHHGMPPPPAVVPKTRMELRSKHISLSPTKHRESMFAYDYDKHKLTPNKSTPNQVDALKRFDKIKEEIETIKLKQQQQTQQQQQPIDSPYIVNSHKAAAAAQQQQQQIQLQQLQQDLRKSNDKYNSEKLRAQSIQNSFFQQKFGTLHAPNRKQRHSILTSYGSTGVHVHKQQSQQQQLHQRNIQQLDQFEDMSFSITEETSTNKTNLPNLNGVDYYYKCKNENKINVSNFLKIPQHQSQSSAHIIDFDSLLTGQAFAGGHQWPQLVNPNISKPMEKSTSLPWMNNKFSSKTKTFYQNYTEENDRRRREGAGFLMLLPGIAIPIETDIVDSDEESGAK